MERHTYAAAGVDLDVANRVKELIKAIRPYKPNIVGIAALIDRSAKSPFGKIPFNGLMKKKIKTYNSKNCPLCKAKIPLVKPGSRKI